MSDIENQPEMNGEELPKAEAEQPAATHKVVEVSCGKCHSEFAIPVEMNVTGFEFDCTNCGAHNSVTDIQ